MEVIASDSGNFTGRGALPPAWEVPLPPVGAPPTPHAARVAAAPALRPASARRRKGCLSTRFCAPLEGLSAPGQIYNPYPCGGVRSARRGRDSWLDARATMGTAEGVPMTEPGEGAPG